MRKLLALLVSVWVLVVLSGCSGTIDARAEQEAEALRPTLGLDETIADLTLSAVVLWQNATGGLYAPDTHLGCDGTEDFCIREVPDMIEGCGEAGTFNGCCDTERHEIRLSESMFLGQKVSTLAHELGHSLGLEHDTRGLMSNRSKAEREDACIDQATLEAFAARYHADPATLTVSCYDSDVRSEMLSLLDGMR